MLALLFVPAGYLLGSLPAGYFVSRWRRGNVGDKGSHSFGATNVARILGWRFGILVVLADIAKSALLVAAVGGIAHSLWLQTAVLLAVALGAVFPVLLRFKGGKGFATLAGGSIVLLPFSAILAFSILWAILLALTKTMSVTNLALAFVFMVSLVLFADPALKLLGVGAVLLLAYSHRENIGRILGGKEPRLSFRL